MKHFFIIREDNPYLIYATRELAEKQLQRIMDLQHTGNIIVNYHATKLTWLISKS